MVRRVTSRRVEIIPPADEVPESVANGYESGVVGAVEAVAASVLIGSRAAGGKIVAGSVAFSAANPAMTVRRDDGTPIVMAANPLRTSPL